MILTIASGKGGTGKTTVSAALGLALHESGEEVHLYDCDVEEPNLHLFFETNIKSSEVVSVPVPDVDLEKCTACGKCAEICRYNAIGVFGKNVLAFHELCHGCGGCILVCPEDAITEIPREVGVMEKGFLGSIPWVGGHLRVGEAMATPLIRAIKKELNESWISIIDASPGTSCPVVESIKGCDYVLLVTEPTPFGLNDLELAVNMVRELDLPFGVVINRSDMGDNRTVEYCRGENIQVLLTIPDSRRIAEGYSRGDNLLKSAAFLRSRLLDMFEKITSGVRV